MELSRALLTQWNSVNAPSGAGAYGEFTQLGRQIVDNVAGRRYRFVKIALSGVSAYEGVPVALVSTFTVSPDASDGKGSTTNGGCRFAGILCTSTTIKPTSGSTAYGWILVEGPLGKIAGSLQQDRTLKTYVISKGGSAGKCFYQSTGDKSFAKFSTQGASTFAKSPVPNLIYTGAALGTSAATSVTAGWIKSAWL